MKTTLILENNEYLLKLLVERVKIWTEDEEVIDLFTQMYDNYLDNGVFEGQVFDVIDIVDNDYINWCATISEGDEGYEEAVEAIKKGLSVTYNTPFNEIAAFSEDLSLILVRW